MDDTLFGLFYIALLCGGMCALLFVADVVFGLLYRLVPGFRRRVKRFLKSLQRWEG